MEKGVILYQFTVFYRELDSLSLLNVIGKPLIKSYYFTDRICWKSKHVCMKENSGTYFERIKHVDLLNQIHLIFSA